MRINKLIASTALVVVAATCAPAVATPISIVNAGFETLPAGGLNSTCGAGCAYSNSAIPGWSTTGLAGTGQFQPNNTYFNTVPDPTTVAYTNDGTISQIVGNAFAGTEYDLMVDLGFRKDHADPGTITLQIGTTSVLATGIANQLSGDWATYTASYIATSADTGAPITILLASTGAQGDFDNVRLNAIAAVPEPLTLSLLGAGLFGAISLRGRKKTRQI